MRKRTSITNLLLGILIGCLITTTSTVYGADVFQSISVVINKVNLSVNGKPVQAANILYNGTTYVPIRAVADMFGKTTDWDAQTNTASINDAGYVEPAQSTNQGANVNINPQTIKISLCKIANKYYYIDNPANVNRVITMNYQYVKINSETLVFASDIKVNPGGTITSSDGSESKGLPYFMSWDLSYLIRLALINDYEIEEVENPYIDGFINITSPNLELNDISKVGIDDIQYISASQSYTPMWIEYNGKKIYNLKSDEKGLQVQNGIRYYDGRICVNDVFQYWGINKTISIGEYQGLNYIEIKQ